MCTVLKAITTEPLMHITPEPPTQPISSSSNQPTSLDEGEIWVEYHPASGKAPEILRADSSQSSVVPVPFEFNSDVPPWHPFRSRTDFEQAELFLSYDCTDSFIDSQLKINNSRSPSSHGITMKSAKDMHRTLAKVLQIEDLATVCILLLTLLATLTTRVSSSKQWNLMYRILPRIIAHTRCASKKCFLR
jgi:hypothetical protein